MIVHLNDYKLSECPGGCERTIDTLVTLLPDQVTATANDDVSGDLYVLHNIRTFTDDQLRGYIDKPHVMWSHDIMDTDRMGLKKELIETSMANIFLSPGHLERFELQAGFDVPRAHCIPSVIDTSQFIGQTKAIYKEPCYIGGIYEHKGIDDVLLWARANKTIVYFFGWGDEDIIDKIISSKYGEYCGVADKDQLSKVYSEFETLIHLPQVYEACGRSIIEAYLSGLKIITNNNTGFFSYPWDFGDKDKIREYLEAVPQEYFWIINNAHLLEA